MTWVGIGVKVAVRAGVGERTGGGFVTEGIGETSGETTIVAVGVLIGAVVGATVGVGVSVGSVTDSRTVMEPNIPLEAWGSQIYW